MTGAFVETLKMIKIEHSVFALPFGLLTAFIAAGGLPEPRVLGLIVMAMVLARSAAMAFNRFLDAEIDAHNPRTVIRAIPAGRLSRTYALGFTLICTALFMMVARLLNPLALMLSPVVMVVLLGYSWTKRVTSLCHLVLGVALGLSPLGAWIAVTGQFHWLPIQLGVAVMGWVAGFDIIYACQDIDFDRSQGLLSIPAWLGVGRSLVVSRLLHLVMIALITWVGFQVGLGWLYWVGVGAVILCLVYEHSLVWGGRLDKVDMAFFTMNGVVSLVFGAATIGSVLLA